MTKFHLTLTINQLLKKGRKLALGLVAAFSIISSNALAGEWEDNMDALDNCWAEYDEVYQALPDIHKSSYKQIITAYDKTPDTSACWTASLLTWAQFEELGYTSIIEYRDDFYERRKGWNQVDAILTDWKTLIAENHEEVREELLRREEAKRNKKRKRSYGDILRENIQKHRKCREDAYAKGGSSKQIKNETDKCISKIDTNRYE